MVMDPAILRHEQHMEVGRIIQGDAAELIRTWETRAVAEQPAARRAHHAALLDHLPHFLRLLGESLALSIGPEDRPHEALAYEHGQQRWDLGWSLEEVVRDYQILRLVIMDHLETHLRRPLQYRELQALGLALDEAITASVTSFVKQRDTHLRELEKERESARLQAADYQRRWERLFRNAGLGLTLITLHDHVLVDINAALARLRGEEATALVGRPLRELLASDAWSLFEEAIRQADSEGHHTFETDLIRADGTTIPILAQMMVLPGADGQTFCRALAVQDISDRKTLEEKLRLRMDELSLADRRKNEFLGLLAHELRNPLAPILNALAVLGMTGLSGPQAQDAKDILERQVRLMVRIVDDLLDLTRIAQDKVELRLAPFDLAEAVQEAVQTTAPLFTNQRHQFFVDLPRESLLLNADRDRVVQILVNLLTNAAKYTNPGGSVRLSVKRAGNELVLRVSDSGVGIDADMLPRVFDLFAQEGRSLTQAQGGLGIGLTLVRRLVELHGGHIAVHSDGPGKGSEFSVRLPAAPVVPSSPPVPDPPAAPTALARRVLVVEDRADARHSLATLLQLLGHEVTEADNGARGLEQATADPPHIALIDLGLPDMDGYQVARRLRENLGPAVRLVALTGQAGEEDRKRCLEAGFDEHLAKPVSVEDLNRVLGAG
jgi:PAS domain S-box-containing protein